MSTRNPRITIAWTHQFTRAARPVCHVNASRNVIISVRMKNPMSTDSPDT